MAEAMDAEAARTIKRKMSEPISENKSSVKRLAASTANPNEEASPFELLLTTCEILMDKLSKEDGRTLVHMGRKAHKYVIALEELNRNLEGQNQLLRDLHYRDEAISAKIEQLTQNCSNIAQSTEKKTTFADTLKLRLPSSLPARAQIHPPRNLLTIYPTAELKTTSSNDTKEILTTHLRPEKQCLQIRHMIPINKHGILIETETRKDIDSILKSKDILKAGLTAGLPTKKLPHIIAYGISNENSDVETLTAIHKQNFETLSQQEFNDGFKLSFKTGNKNKPTSNWVIQITPALRRKLSSNRLFIGFNAHHTKDFVPLSRCYKCQCFGHVAKYCQAKHDTCGHCGQDGHSFKDCPRKTKNPVCINCKRANKPHNHSNRANDCPAYKSALENSIKKIDYGY